MSAPTARVDPWKVWQRRFRRQPGRPVRVLDQCSPLFDAIGGDIRFLGSDPAASAVINSSALAFVYGAAHGFLSAAAMCDAPNAPIDLLAEVLGTLGRQSGVNTGLFDEALRTFEAAVAADRGVNLAAIFEELRPKST